MFPDWEYQFYILKWTSPFLIIWGRGENPQLQNDLPPKIRQLLQLIYHEMFWEFEKIENTLKWFEALDLIEDPICFPPPMMFSLCELSLSVVTMKVWPVGIGAGHGYSSEEKFNQFNCCWPSIWLIILTFLLWYLSHNRLEICQEKYSCVSGGSEDRRFALPYKNL